MEVCVLIPPPPPSPIHLPPPSCPNCYAVLPLNFFLKKQFASQKSDYRENVDLATNSVMCVYEKHFSFCRFIIIVHAESALRGIVRAESLSMPPPRFIVWLQGETDDIHGRV